MMLRHKKEIASIFIASVGTFLLLILTNTIRQVDKQSLMPYFVYQAASLVISILVIAGMYFLQGRKLSYLKLGKPSAKATPLKLLGIKKGESWRSVGVTFTIIITLVTGLFLYLNYKSKFGGIEISSWLLAFMVAIPLSVSNAFNEEIITRWAVVEGLSGKYAKFAPWVSMFIFGSVHYFGIPGGFVGSLMAGFLAWLLARSIQDTGGIAWAWFIHFCQDMLIFTVIIVQFI